MSSLFYLIKKELKNRLRRLVHKPGLLLVYVLFSALMIYSLVIAFSNKPDLGETMDIRWLKLIFTAYLLIYARASISAGVTQGSSIFSMADANLVFVSPINSKMTLFYGLLRQVSSSVLASVFILFMGNTLRSLWGLGTRHLLILFTAYFLSLIIFQFASMCIYMYTNGRPLAKKLVNALFYICLLPAIITVAINALGGRGIGPSVLAMLDGGAMLAIPIVGWVSEAVFAIFAANTGMTALATGLILGSVALTAVLLVVGKPDYYEDVLIATESVYQKKRAVEEGNIHAMERTNRRIKINGNGIWGNGAKVFFGKHMLESFRSNRLKILDATSLSFIGVAVLMAFILRKESDIIMVLATTMGMRTMLVGTGRGLKELFYHYIFLAPCSSFSKIVWSNVELAFKCLAESIIAYTLAGIIMRENPLVITMCIITTAVFSLVLISVNLLSMRIFADVISQGLLLTLYFLFIVLSMAPGIIGATMTSGLAAGAVGVAIGLAVLTLWEVLLAGLFFYLSRGVLHSCDMETTANR